MSKKMTPQKIAYIINDCLDGVDRSNVGPVYIKDIYGNIARDAGGGPIISHVAFNVLMVVIQSSFMRNFNDWEGIDV